MPPPPPPQSKRFNSTSSKSSYSKNGNNNREFEKTPESHADRAAQLLAKARASASTIPNKIPIQQMAIRPPKHKVASGPSSEISNSLSETPIPLPSILKSLVNSNLGNAAFTVKEAIPLAGKLVRGKLNTQLRLSHLNGIVLEDVGITSELDKQKILIAFGVKEISTVGDTSLSSTSKRKDTTNNAGTKRSLETILNSTSKSSSPNHKSTNVAIQSIKRKRLMDDEALSREYGNVSIPKTEPGQGNDEIEYVFNEILDEEQLKTKYVLVNRAPIMTVWSMIVLERLGFERREALSLAFCYVNTTSTARGVSLGIIPASEQDRSLSTIGSNQPHFELMGVKIPLIKLGQTQEWRGISKGEVIGPDQAFNYMRKSMYQTLPAVMGSLSLLADSYVNNSPSFQVKKEDKYDDVEEEVAGPDLLHKKAYDLYTQFRPSTAGEWGKKSMFYCSKALALRRGFEFDLDRWNEIEEGEELESKIFQQELEAIVAAQGRGEGEEISIGEEENEPNIKLETTSNHTIKRENYD